MTTRLALDQETGHRCLVCGPTRLDATGVWLTETPFTAERVWRAIAR